MMQQHCIMTRIIFSVSVKVAMLSVMLPALASDGAAASLHVAAVQMRSSRDINANVANIQQQLKRCADKGVRVAVFPECALTGYFDDIASTTSAEHLAEAEKQIAESCKAADIYAVVGMPYWDGKNLFNSAAVFAPSGKVIARYHKIQLAERWPDPGDRLSVFKVDGIPCSIIICHDERYPELVRLPVLAGAQVVFYLSHESGVLQEKKIGPYRAQIQARAVENTVFVVHANAPAQPDSTGSHGQSRIISPDGNLIGPEASIYNEEVINASVDIGLATRANALNSLNRGPLAKWWREGIHLVQMVDDKDAD